VTLVILLGSFASFAAPQASYRVMPLSLRQVQRSLASRSQLIRVGVCDW
jgi:hypothetical protein